MKIPQLRDNLINLISLYLKGESSLDELNTFAWKVINYFSDKAKNDLPPIEDFEREFWYAIWQIQHLADSSHENEGLTKKEFERVLEFLKNEKKLPEQYYGSRP